MREPPYSHLGVEIGTIFGATVSACGLRKALTNRGGRSFIEIIILLIPT